MPEVSWLSDNGLTLSIIAAILLVVTLYVVIRRLSEALEQQRASADVLRAISQSTDDLQSVLVALAATAAQLCKVEAAAIIRPGNGKQNQVAHIGFAPEYYAYLKSMTLLPNPDTLVGRVLLEGEAVQISDTSSGDFLRSHREPFQTLLGVPLLREGVPMGAMVLARSMAWPSRVRRLGEGKTPGLGRARPLPFDVREINLAMNFAAQAVIAIENARLFDEVQTRTRELREALEQQTATAEILRVISTSPTDAQPVFEAIVRNAVSLCGSLLANVFRFDGELLHYVTSHNVGPSSVALLQTKYPMRPDSSQVAGRVILTKSVAWLEDAFADPDYDQRFSVGLGFRRMLGVPMLRKGTPVGVIVVGWVEPGPSSKAQEELLKGFADQAVIAIENARLFDQVQEKSRQLELANTYKSRFLAAASHDLRQPLHALNLFIAQLHAEQDTVARTRLVEHIRAAVGSMNELFDALLDMSKLDAGVLEPHLTEFPIQRLLERLKTTFADAAREKGLHLHVVPSRTWVCSDFILLERIALNLVSNAVRYTARGGVVIGCRRRGNRLRVEVCDSGIGIPEDEQPRIFGEFYQLGARQPDRRSGLGLGLSIVDRLGRLLEHPVELVSRPGKGSRFCISVPLVVPRRPAVDAAEQPATFTDRAEGKLVVVIDDDPLVLNGMRGILRSWGCSVVTAASDSAALAQLAEGQARPDLIISDYRLADGKTGIEAIERLREALGAAIPAFLISGDTAPERLREASASGYHLLHKPVPPMALRTTLNRILKTPRFAADAAQSTKC